PRTRTAPSAAPAPACACSASPPTTSPARRRWSPRSPRRSGDPAARRTSHPTATLRRTDPTTGPAPAHVPAGHPSGAGRVDVAACLARSGCTGPVTPDASTLRALHRAHTAAVPYENLDIQPGVAEPLSPAGAPAKITAPGRGGYCYELNG